MQISKTKVLLDQSISTFSNINNKIDLLIDCSAKDFDILNNSFQHYHSKIKELTSDTDKHFRNNIEISESITESKSETLNTIIPELNGNYTNAINTNREITLIIKELSYIFLHVNNLKQNISTLKLLTTNMKLEPKLNKTHDEMIDFINNLMHCTHNFENELQKTESQLIKCSELFNQICNHNYASFIHVMQDYIDLLSKLALSKNIWIEYDNKLNSLMKKQTSSSAEIITNLQFQDIIRQKIEHVQEAQNALLQKLREYHSCNKDAGNSNDKDILHIIFQIQNIGSLQAAQMVHANSEYQKAIDTITSRFEELDFILMETVIILQNISQYPMKNNGFSIAQFRSSYSSVIAEFKSLRKLNAELEHTYTEMFREENILVNTGKNLKCGIENCNSLILKLQKHKHENSRKSFNPVDQLIENFKSFLHSSDETNNALSKIQDRIKNNILPGMEMYFNITLKSDKALNYHLQLTQEKYLNNTDIQSDKSLSISEMDLNKIKFNSHDLQYHNVFEKEVEDIIEQINNLCNQIDFKHLENNFNQEDIKKIQSLYTMQSEREIHAIITGEQVESNDGDDIELF